MTKKLPYPEIEQNNYYGINVNKLKETIEGELTFIGFYALSITGAGWRPVVLFHNSNPNRIKGHKDYVFLFGLLTEDFSDEDVKMKYFISGRDEIEMQKERFQHGVLCNSCNKILYSAHRHDFHKCGCNNQTFIDGGQEYLRYGAKILDKVQPVTIDILTNTFSLGDENNGKKS